MDETNDYTINGQAANIQSETHPIEAIEQAEQIENTPRLEHQLKSGADWFYWIAGLTIINTITYILNYDWSFINGLAITQIIDAIAYDFTGTLKATFVMLDVFIASIFVYLGYCAGKRKKWAFISGMIIYTLDALIFLFFKDFLSVGFHIMALYGIYGGLKAGKHINKGLSR